MNGLGKFHQAARHCQDGMHIHVQLSGFQLFQTPTFNKKLVFFGNFFYNITEYANEQITKYCLAAAPYGALYSQGCRRFTLIVIF